MVYQSEKSADQDDGKRLILEKGSSQQIYWR